jgi:hypothetical protein
MFQEDSAISGENVLQAESHRYVQTCPKVDDNGDNAEIILKNDSCYTYKNEEEFVDSVVSNTCA